MNVQTAALGDVEIASVGAGHRVGELLERIMELAPPRPVRSPREGTRAALRAARTCHDHLPGRLGCGLSDRFLAASWIDRRKVGRGVRVTPSARAALAALFGIEWR